MTNSSNSNLPPVLRIRRSSNISGGENFGHSIHFEREYVLGPRLEVMLANGKFEAICKAVWS
jgi:hypothetical protein